VASPSLPHCRKLGPAAAPRGARKRAVSAGGAGASGAPRRRPQAPEGEPPGSALSRRVGLRPISSARWSREGWHAPPGILLHRIRPGGLVDGIAPIGAGRARLSGDERGGESLGARAVGDAKAWVEGECLVQ